MVTTSLRLSIKQGESSDNLKGMLMEISSSASRMKSVPPKLDDPLWQAAVDLEASFLSEMLKSAGLGKTSEAFGGGEGEDQFQSLLIKEQANAMARSGGIGLAEQVFNSLKKSEAQQK